MNTYIVRWEIDIDADNPRQAAEKALEIQRDAGSDATVFSVFDKLKEETVVDLEVAEETQS